MFTRPFYFPAHTQKKKAVWLCETTTVMYRHYYGGQEGSATKAATYIVTYVAAYNNRPAAKLRLADTNIEK